MMLDAVMAWIASAPQGARGTKGIEQQLDKWMHIGVGKRLLRTASHIGKFEVYIIKARQIENWLKGINWLIYLWIAHVVNDQTQVRVALRNHRHLVGLLSA